MAVEVKLNVEEMEKAGVQFGHRISKLYPKMKPYVSGIKNNVHVFDLEKTSKEFEKALKFISRLVSENKTVLLVGTKVQLRHLVKKAAVESGMPYVSGRWLGGTFTNFETIAKRVDYFKELERKKMSGELEKYTKKERSMFDKELRILETKFEGIRNMAKLPDAIFITGLDTDITAAKEAKIKGIPVIAIVDSNMNPELVDYQIPANDDAISAVKYILDQVQETIKNARA
jgi:small subunit ribosomal protein S2